ncbi:MAG: desulfoferrodoxin family protein [Oscillospiraceae bacterium]
MCEQKFFRCTHCGNLIGLINNAGIPLICCGEKMQELVANTTQASTEKHLPEVTVSGDTVTVQIGSVIHPMLEEHHIEFIYLQTENGGQRKSLKVGEEPVAVFKVVDDKPIAVFEYCNLHGLWTSVL